jgi:hypothetical protein
LHFYRGHFETRPFVLVIAVGALVTAHTLAIAVYYVLPVDAEGKKYIPGKWCVWQLGSTEEQTGLRRDKPQFTDPTLRTCPYYYLLCAGFRRLVEECLGNEQEAANLLDR